MEMEKQIKGRCASGDQRPRLSLSSFPLFFSLSIGKLNKVASLHFMFFMLYACLCVYVYMSVCHRLCPK